MAQKTLDTHSFSTSSHTLSRGQHIDLDDLLKQWRRMGYQFEASVYTPGVVSRRGGILDVFPVGSSVPARIELWGNEIDSIRLFDPATQRSTDIVESIEVIPAQETLPGLMDRDYLDGLMGSIDISNCTQTAQERIREEFDLLLNGHEVEEVSFYSGLFNGGSLLDYFPDNGLLVMYRPSDIAAAAWDVEERALPAPGCQRSGAGELPLRFPSSLLPWSGGAGEDIGDRPAAGYHAVGRRRPDSPGGPRSPLHVGAHVPRQTGQLHGGC